MQSSWINCAHLETYILAVPLPLPMPVPVASPAISHYFPRLVQATSTVLVAQACFVPSSTRVYDHNGCLFVLNTPDAVAGRVITEPEVRLACTKARVAGFKDVTRHNNNIFVASFETRSRARHTDNYLKLDFPVLSAGATSSITSSLTIGASQYVEGPHQVFCCVLRMSSIMQATVYKRVLEALDDSQAACSTCGVRGSGYAVNI